MAPPATGKMVKGLIMCYTVIFLTFYSAAVSGYWVFGNKSNSNIVKSLMPDEGPSLAPIWVLGLAVAFILLQLFAIGLVRISCSIIISKSLLDLLSLIFLLQILDPGVFSSSLRDYGKEISRCESGHFLQKKLDSKDNSTFTIRHILWVLCSYATFLWRYQCCCRSHRVYPSRFCAPYASL